MDLPQRGFGIIDLLRPSNFTLAIIFRYFCALTTHSSGQPPRNLSKLMLSRRLPLNSIVRLRRDFDACGSYGRESPVALKDSGASQSKKFLST